MATVDCQECSKNFQTFKLYIKHLLTKECKGKQKPEEQLSAEPENKRLKVSPKLFQKKKQNEPDSTTRDDRVVVPGKPVYVPVRGSVHGTVEQTAVKKTIMQNMNQHKIASSDKFIVTQEDSGLKISSVTSLGGSKPTQQQARPSSYNAIPNRVPTPQLAQRQPIPAPKPGKLPCTLCSKLVKSRGMTQHMNMQHKCKYCSVMAENVEQHISETHEREPCEYCSKKCENEAALEKHIELTHLQKCEQCEEEFYSEENLQAHVVDVHESEDCDICDIKFLIADKMMDEHKDKVHGIKTKTIKQFGGMMFMMVSD